MVGSAIVLNAINTNNTKNQTIAESDKPAADHLKAMAVAAEKTNVTQARALFETARRQYEYVVDNTTDTAIHDAAQNGIIDCNGQIWLIDHGYIK